MHIFIMTRTDIQITENYNFFCLTINKFKLYTLLSIKFNKYIIINSFIF